MKVLKKESLASVEELTRELHHIAKVPPHRNVVQLCGFSLAKERPFLVFELCETGAVDAYLRASVDANQRPGVKTRLGWAIDACNGLLHLHAHRVVHRDVAARNLLLSNGVAKLTDFGLARVMSAEESAAMTKCTTGPIR